jgi:xylan 1,4-beta-xylosidase
MKRRWTIACIVAIVCAGAVAQGQPAVRRGEQPFPRRDRPNGAERTLQPAAPDTPPLDAQGRPNRDRPGPWDNDVLVYRVSSSGKPEQVATFERAGVPTVARLRDGRLIAAHQHFPKDNDADFDKVAVRFSSDDGRHWTPPQVIDVQGLPAGMRFPFDPTLVPLADGRVRLYFTGNMGRTFQRSTPAIHSAISTDGLSYAYEPGVRFAVDGRMIIDCAVVLHNGVFHLYAPDNGVEMQPGVPPRNQTAANRPREGRGYHATSKDGLSFTRVDDVQIEGRRRWLGNAQSDSRVITFFGTGDPGATTVARDGQPSGGVWMAVSNDGQTWKLAAAPPLPVADPGAVATRDGGWIIVGTGPPRRQMNSPQQGKRPNAQGGAEPGRRPDNDRSATGSPAAVRISHDPPQEGPKQLEVDAGKSIGKLYSLLGTNRGPLIFSRELGRPPENLTSSYRRFGIDTIRTHDFYGPTDWHTIFPRWNADPEDPASYDFVASDLRIKPILDSGFQCFYRLGTSWKGARTEPINDPPGTLRGADGQVTHRADRADFQKWARIGAQTVAHYTQGWKDGFNYPIQYWEIWNEPDLAAQFWTGTPEQYYMLYEEAAKALKQLNPELKVGGPACTGALREAYVEGLLRYCRDRHVPLDFFSWHSYGGRDDFNPYQFYRDAMRIRKALDQYGFQNAENIVTEWNAGIQQRLFSDTPEGAAFYASTLACLLDAHVDRAFQYCGDRHPGLGLHDIRTGEPQICAYALAAWKQLLETPQRIEATGSDQRGYNIVAGRSADSRSVQVLISDFRSGYQSFRLRLKNLSWASVEPLAVKRWLLDGEHRFALVETSEARGPELFLERPLHAGSVCLMRIEERSKP